jgi:antitoxin (DNA-binding transcriptional repressor) of toxin-antitoxin stability system
MKEINAAELRRSLGKIEKTLSRGEPVLLKIRGRAIGAIVPLRDFRERFVEVSASAERLRLVEEILADRTPARGSLDDVIRDLRDR